MRIRRRHVPRTGAPGSGIGAGAPMLAALLAAAALTALPAAPAHAEDGVTTIEEISIEGEVRLPRVLFITSRDIARPLDFLDHYAVDPAAVFGPRPEPGPIPVLDGPLAAASGAAPGPAGPAPAAPAAAPGVVPADTATPENPSPMNPTTDGSSEEVHQ